ncbi:maleylpyruvate isomerase family mycothiol-dependent enzyme [Nakamurella endophytica]|uniref:Mycothiol-dependent maleylpyruvate isomerase metal-binding domain-containing protein n=1 Tax=Nakamurella endophytica TaxID=1748367 RepID=A0A917SKX5_9ACTN|nr:maleylpyruvate isomerase family mycothiol-dependent enzyme [Nakamurella endophytica]GGL85702.1 hypothetical protein GCM10011594_01720 [Nakamurella endophytica]
MNAPAVPTDDAALAVLLAQGRRRLADVLESLAPDRWDAPSLCDGWRVRDVVAHLTMPFRYRGPRVLAEMVLAGGFHRMADRVARRDGSRLSPAQLVAAVRDNADHPWRPPGGGAPGALTHDTVHALDVTDLLGLRLEIEAPAWVVVLDQLAGQRSLRHFGLDLSGVRVEARDVGWSTGAGELLAGNAADLVPALAGRSIAADRVHGPGVQRLPRLRRD